jgi:ABC-type molybdate transport system ATPase subunit
VLDHPAQPALVQLAGFENIFDATVTGRREQAGTMQCLIAATSTELEVPLGDAEAGSAIQVAIRAGDILLSKQEPAGISARNIMPGRVAGFELHGSTVVATIDAGVPFVVHLTAGGADTLDLRAGQTLWLIIKTYSCRVAAR